MKRSLLSGSDRFVQRQQLACAVRVASFVAQNQVLRVTCGGDDALTTVYRNARVRVIFSVFHGIHQFCLSGGVCPPNLKLELITYPNHNGNRTRGGLPTICEYAASDMLLDFVGYRLLIVSSLRKAPLLLFWFRPFNGNNHPH